MEDLKMKNFEYRTFGEIEYYNDHAGLGIEWLAKKLIKESGRNPYNYKIKSMCRNAYYEALVIEHEIADIGYEDDYPEDDEVSSTAMRMAKEFIMDMIDDEDFLNGYAR